TMVPHNFLAETDTADICHSGAWTTKAIAAARRFGKVHVACTSEPAFDHTPAAPVYSASPRYVYYTSNKTVYGTQWASPPPDPAGAARVRRVERHLQPAAAAGASRADLRRRAEEPRAVGHHAGDRAQGLRRDAPARPAAARRLHDLRHRGLDAEHAQHVRYLH